MITPELLKYQIEKEFFEKTYHGFFSKGGKIEDNLFRVEKQVIPHLQKRTAALKLLRDSELEIEYLKLRQSVFDLEHLLELNFHSYRDFIAPAPLPQPIQKRMEECFHQCTRILDRMQFKEDEVLAYRRKRIRSSFEEMVEKSLKTIERLLKESDDAWVRDEKEKKEASFFSDHEKILNQLATYFDHHFDLWEKLVVREARSFIFHPPQLPIRIIYSTLGTIYLTLEVAGHALGRGAGKIACRSIALQTGQCFALLQPRTVYTDPVEKERWQARAFPKAWRETEILVKLRGSEGIIQLHERYVFLLEKQKSLYLIEDYFKDRSLLECLRKIERKNPLFPPFSAQENIQIMRQLLTGVLNMQTHKIVHCDLKPANILINRGSVTIRAAITDFNVARDLDHPLIDPLVGTHLYMSPELAREMQKENQTRAGIEQGTSFKNDVWGMGCVLYNLLFKSPLPWHSDEEEKSYAAIASLSEQWIPKQFKTDPFFPLVEKMLMVDPNKRISIREAIALFEALAKKTTPIP
jgi:serine/threonine protein kinase